MMSCLMKASTLAVLLCSFSASAVTLDYRHEYKKDEMEMRYRLGIKYNF